MLRTGQPAGIDLQIGCEFARITAEDLVEVFVLRGLDAGDLDRRGAARCRATGGAANTSDRMLRPIRRIVCPDDRCGRQAFACKPVGEVNGRGRSLPPGSSMP